MEIHVYALAVAAKFASARISLICAQALSQLAIRSSEQRQVVRKQVERCVASLLPALATGRWSSLLTAKQEALAEAPDVETVPHEQVMVAVLQAMMGVLIEDVPDRRLLQVLILELDYLRQVIRRHRRRWHLPSPIRLRKASHLDLPVIPPLVAIDSFRSSAVSLLERAMEQPIVVVVAGPGYDLQALVGHLLLVQRHSFVWLSGERTGSAPALMVADLLAQLGEEQSADDIQLAVARVTLALCDEPLSIIVDGNGRLCEACRALLRSLMMNSSGSVVWLVIAETREGISWLEDVPEGKVRWVTAADLRFTASDVIALVRQRGLDIGSSEVQGILQATDGWPIAVEETVRCWSSHDELAVNRRLASYIDQHVLPSLSREEQSILRRLALDEAWMPSSTNATLVAGVQHLYERGFMIQAGTVQRIVRPLLLRVRQLVEDESASARVLELPEHGAEADGGTRTDDLLGIQLLGEFSVWRGGKLILHDSWRKRKVRALFAILAMQHSRVHRDVLLEWLWPALDVSSAQNNLKFTVHHLRRALEPELTHGSESLYIIYELDHYSLCSEFVDRVDAEEFARLVERGTREEHIPLAIEILTKAHACYRGEFAPEFRYDDWAIRERDRLRELWLTGTERLATLLIQSGRVEEAIGISMRALEVDPTREVLHRCIMQGYRALGDRSAVQRQYTRLREILQRDLGLEPSPSTEALLLELG